MMSSQQFNSSINNRTEFSIENIKSKLIVLNTLEERTNFLKQQITQLNQQLKKNFNDPVTSREEKFESISEYLELSFLKKYLTAELSFSKKEVVTK